MPQKKYKPAEIFAKLRQVDVWVSQGRSVAKAVRTIGVTQFTDYCWRREYVGLKTDQVKCRSAPNFDPLSASKIDPSG